MKNPFHLLNLATEVDDSAVEAAYQRLVALHPETTSPNRAKEIAWAYSTIKKERDRIRFKLFETPTADIPTLLGPSLIQLNPALPSESSLLAPLRHALKTYQLTIPDPE
ncbi:MAG: hypothetical protein HQL67_00240 [Magnetococcales bacterium]|nr:hypothetical protein [Magnetococcales bacterium]